MGLHGNARTCLHSRSLIVERVLEQRLTIAAAAEAAGISERTAAKWLARYRAEGTGWSARPLLGAKAGAGADAGGVAFLRRHSGSSQLRECAASAC